MPASKSKRYQYLLIPPVILFGALFLWNQVRDVNQIQQTTDAIKHQASGLLTIDAALLTYHRDHGQYPTSLKDLLSTSTSGSLLPAGKLPLDYSDVPFQYSTNADRSQYSLCYENLVQTGSTTCYHSR